MTWDERLVEVCGWLMVVMVLALVVIGLGAFVGVWS